MGTGFPSCNLSDGQSLGNYGDTVGRLPLPSFCSLNAGSVVHSMSLPPMTDPEHDQPLVDRFAQRWNESHSTPDVGASRVVAPSWSDSKEGIVIRGMDSYGPEVDPAVSAFIEEIYPVRP